MRRLAAAAGIDFKPTRHGYPHFYYVDDKIKSGVIEIAGERARQMLDYALSNDLSHLKPGKSEATSIATPKGKFSGVLTCVNRTTYRLSLPPAKAGFAAAWLRDLSDGYLSFDLDGNKDNGAQRMPGPFIVTASRTKPAVARSAPGGKPKPWFLGIEPGPEGKALPSFEWIEPPEGEPRFTRLHDTHKSMGARMVPFAGWDMPVWYTSVVEEHLATRQTAGLFDVSHMGVYDVRGRDAASFLDSVCGNDCGGLMPGESLYTHFLTPEANVVDDTLVYRRRWDNYLVVVNASNDDKDRTWLESVRDGRVCIDSARPWARTCGWILRFRARAAATSFSPWEWMRTRGHAS